MNTIDYLFFHQQHCDLFTTYLDKEGIPWQTEIEPIQDAILVQVNEVNISPIWDAVDDYYEQLAEQDELHLMTDPEDNISVAGIHIALSNGTHTIAKVSPETLNKVLDVLTNEEFTTFIDAIARSVESPDDTPICKTS